MGNIVPPFVFIRDAIQNAYERHSQMQASGNSGEGQANNPFVTIIQQNLDNAVNSGQSTQARFLYNNI